MKLNGRDESGYVIGSAAQREALRLAKHSAECEGRAEGLHREHLLKRLDAPGWVRGKCAPPSSSRQGRVRSRARDAADELGVPVPEWAEIVQRVSKYYVPER